eukprot:m.56643 g.56643  ORF g.56643 m.56643 type:complete len:214 (+) comp13405_c0_seq1:45-686(+)
MEGTSDHAVLLEGDMASMPADADPGASDEALDTLDEPVLVTLKRDLFAICQKFYHVLRPHKSRRLLQDWDLWGPLMLTVTLAMVLRSTVVDEQKTQVFTGVFFIICFGSCVVTINSKLLGGNLSFFQSVCVLGYCMFPLVMACLLLRLLSFVVSHLVLRLLLVAAGYVWSLHAAMGFIGKNCPSNRKVLIIYPIFLFYVVIAWLIINDVRPGA